MQKIRFSIVCTLALLMGCTGFDQKEFENRPVEEIYTRAKTLLDSGHYNQAAEAFAEVERQHPYSSWALRAQLMSAYAYYEVKKYEEAIEGFNVFIQLHPGHQDVPYAYYMVGLCYYEQIPTVKRDQSVTEKARNSLQEIINRFPKSPYARDAQFKIDLIVDHLAGKEMDVGRFYIHQKAYLAAVNRFKHVVDHYQTSSHIHEALHRMVECYLAMGLMVQAQQAAAVLGHNAPDSPWYAQSYHLLTTHLPQDRPTDKIVAPQSPKQSEMSQHPPRKPTQEPDKRPPQM